MSQYSLNSRLVLEVYKTDGSVRMSVTNGWAKTEQKSRLVGLKVLMSCYLQNNYIQAGSTAYIREEILHTAPWAKNPLSCDTLSQPFMVVDSSLVEFIDQPEGPVA